MTPGPAAPIAPKQREPDPDLFACAHRFAKFTARSIAAVGCLALLASAASSQDRGRAPGTYGDAMRWYGKAAEAGSTRAQFLLGLKFENGGDGEPDPGKAVEWFRRAAMGGHALAQYRLATALHEGRGVDRNVAEAAAWYGRAAESGIPEAAFNLGFILDKGLSGTVDPLAAAKWYGIAAKAGLGPAQFNLGVLHAEGRGVARDPAEAWIWFTCAAAAGQVGAGNYASRVDETMDADQRAFARIGVARRCPGQKDG